MKLIKLSLTEDYVSHWSWWQGARELLQNAIDTGEFKIEFGQDSLHITSHGGKIPVNALLMGKSSKKEDPTTIGKFGEGMKLGFLVLLREGADIEMLNGEDYWKPKFVYDEVFDSNVLAIEIDEGSIINQEDSVEINIYNIPTWAISEIKDNYAPTTSRDIVIENSRGKAYAKDSNNHECVLFVNGLYVTTLMNGKYKFDYDFKPETFVLDRDRDSVNEYELKYNANNLLSESDDIELLAQLALENYDDLSLFNGRRKKNSSYYSSSRDQDEEEQLSDKAVELFEKKYGYTAYPINENWSDGKKRVVTQTAIAKGYTPVTVKQAVYRMVQNAYDVDHQVEEILSFKPLDFLESFLTKHKRRLYSKPRREIEGVVKLLRIAEGKD